MEALMQELLELSEQGMKLGGFLIPDKEAIRMLSQKHKKDNFLIQEKLDGFSCIAAKKNGKVILFTGGERTNPQLKPTVDVLNEWMVEDSIVHGELGFGTESETRRAAKYGYHRFVVFDLLKWGGRTYEGVDTGNRYSDLNYLYKRLCLKQTIVQLVPTTLCNSDALANAAWDFYSDVIKENGEGIVIKLCSAPLRSGTTCKDFYKIKKYISNDYVCMRFTPSDAPTYIQKGMAVAAMVYGAYFNGVLKEVGSVSGFPFEMRKAFFERPQDFIGRTVEVGGFGVFKSGAMRHPMIMRFREDKAPSACTIESILKNV